MIVSIKKAMCVGLPDPRPWQLEKWSFRALVIRLSSQMVTLLSNFLPLRKSIGL